MIRHTAPSFFIMLLALLISGPAIGAGPVGVPEEAYLAHRRSGDYAETLEALTRWTIGSTDPVLIEANIFRIGELVAYPELIADAERSCEKILTGNPLINKNPFLWSRAELARLALLLKKGDITRARELRSRLGFIEKYAIIGPFKNETASDFETVHTPEREFERERVYRGKSHSVSWFDAGTGLDGVLDVNEKGSGTEDSLYYAHARFSVASDGRYCLSMGKTGYADVYLDGRRIFRNRSRHRAGVDQYRLMVTMVRGHHRLLIKTGDSRPDGIKISLRITDGEGRIASVVEADDGPLKPGDSSPVAAAYFTGLDALLGDRDVKATRPFLTGYFFHASGLSSDTGHEAARHLGRAVDAGDHASQAEYYMALTETDLVKRERHLRESIRLDPHSLEPLEQLARLKIEKGFLFEALPLIERIRDLNPSSPVGKRLEAELFIVRGWYVEAMKAARALKTMRFPSAGMAIEARVLGAQKKYRQAARVLESLRVLDRRNEQLNSDLLEYLEEGGQAARAITLLEELAAESPGDAGIRWRLATLVKNAWGTRDSLPYLSAALKLSPFDKRILRDLGLAYHSEGMAGPAQYYLELALQLDPDDFQLRNYLEIIRGAGSELFEFRVRDDPAVIAGRIRGYEAEPALVLLDECVIRVLADGSYEKSVRRIIKINDPGAIDDFDEQYIILSPSTDHVENLRCIVINDGNRLESRENYQRSLSDPESRMYYDLQARIVPVPSLRAGSIIDLVYRVKSAAGSGYRGYFGERIAAGGEYRTILSNTVVSVPDDKEIVCRLKGIAKSSLQLVRRNDSRIYRVSLRNIPPCRKEPAMPDPYALLPAVIFTSHADWASVHRWYMALARDRMLLSGEMRARVAALTSGKSSDLDKIRAIFDHVNGTIRYVGFELGLGGIQPRRADLTYGTGMGDCKDISVVLAAMLREAGFDARIALVRTRDRGAVDRSIPFLGQFNHAVCYVNVQGGLFFDATAKMSGFRELPYQDRDVDALVMDEHGYSFVNTRGDFYSKSEDSSETEVIVHENGSAVMNRTITKSGDFARGPRLELADVKSKLLTISEYWNDRFAGAGAGNLMVHNSGLESPVSYSYVVDIPSLFTPVEDFLVTGSFLVPSGYHRTYTLTRDRQSPLVIAGMVLARNRITYHFPAGYRIFRLPEAGRMSGKNYEARFSCTRNGDTSVVVESVVSFTGYGVGVEEYSRFRDFTIFIDRKENEAIIVKREKPVHAGN